MNVFRYFLLGVLLAGYGPPSPGAGNLDPAKPNVLLIYYDDLGYGDVGVHDLSQPSLTPRLDHFATQSLRFTAGHSAAGVCTPSRYALLTGRYAWRTSLKRRVTGGYSGPLIEADRFTFAGMFQSLGYATAIVGKWHVGMQFYDPSGNPVDLGDNDQVLRDQKVDFSKPLTDTPYHRGFDYYYGTSTSLNSPPYCWIENDTVLYQGGIVSGGAVDFSLASPAINSDFREGAHPGGGFPGAYDPTFNNADCLQIQARKVSDLLAARAADGRPFFIYVSVPAPHTPWTVQPAFAGSAGFAYGDYVVQTDHYTGVMLDALADPDGDPDTDDSLVENTIVFVSSDNGPEGAAVAQGLSSGHDPNGPFRGVKRDSWEGGTRVPFMIRWPGKVTPGTTGHPCWQGDFFASMAAYLGYDFNPGEAPDAESFLPVLLGGPMPAARRAAFIQHSSLSQFAIVEKNGVWKLIDGTGGGGSGISYDADDLAIIDAVGTIRGAPRQLFDLSSDPGERTNLLAPTLPPAQASLDREADLMALLNGIRGDTTTGSDGDSNIPPADNDADDIPNAFENAHPGLDRDNPADRNADLDHDGLSNIEEYHNRSDPNRSDSDNDRLGDYAEVHTYGTRAGDAHSDADTLPDGREILVWGTNPLAADSDGDGVNDDDELAAFSNPRNRDAMPLPGLPEVTILDPVAVQPAGVNATTGAPQVEGGVISGWAEAGTLFVREQSVSGSNQQWRTRLFLKFDLDGLNGTPEEARLRVHQINRLNTEFEANIEIARVTGDWGTTDGHYPLFDGTTVADAFVFGNNGDFGEAIGAMGFYGGTPGAPAIHDWGFDPSGQVTSIVRTWSEGTQPNYGFRIAFTDRTPAGAAFSDADDPATPGANERLQLRVTTRARDGSLDGDGDCLLDGYEIDVFGSLDENGDGDWDLDQVSNFLEQALGSDPRDSTSRPLLELGPDGAAGATLAFHRHRSAGLGYEVLISEDLAQWDPFNRYFSAADPPPPSERGPDYDRVRLEPHTRLPDLLFIRLSVSAGVPHSPSAPP